MTKQKVYKDYIILKNTITSLQDETEYQKITVKYDYQIWLEFDNKGDNKELIAIGLRTIETYTFINKYPNVLTSLPKPVSYVEDIILFLKIEKYWLAYNRTVPDKKLLKLTFIKTLFPEYSIPTESYLVIKK